MKDPEPKGRKKKARWRIMLPTQYKKGKMIHHAKVFIGYVTEGIHTEMSLEDLCSLMHENGFHVHATSQECKNCEKVKSK